MSKASAADGFLSVQIEIAFERALRAGDWRLLDDAIFHLTGGNLNRSADQTQQTPPLMSMHFADCEPPSRRDFAHDVRSLSPSIEKFL